MSTNKDSESTAPTSSAAAVLTREQRLACWDSRDAYYQCKTTRSVGDCEAERVAFERLCPAAWVSSCGSVWQILAVHLLRRLPKTTEVLGSTFQIIAVYGTAQL